MDSLVYILDIAISVKAEHFDVNTLVYREYVHIVSVRILGKGQPFGRCRVLVVEVATDFNKVCVVVLQTDAIQVHLDDDGWLFTVYFERIYYTAAPCEPSNRKARQKEILRRRYDNRCRLFGERYRIIAQSKWKCHCLIPSVERCLCKSSNTVPEMSSA